MSQTTKDSAGASRAPGAQAPDAQAPDAPGLERIASVLLAVAAGLLAACAFFAWAWWRSETGPIQPQDLSPEQRQALVERLVETSPGIYRWTFFEPHIAYTLRPEAEITAWDDSFVSNSLGYRTGPPEKAPGTFRVLFVGDSWTYGMGVTWEQSYPKVFERLAAEHAGLGGAVEAWTLALPGYNTFNQVGAFEYFFDALRPDAVVFAPSSNDHHSSSVVLPNGSPWRGGRLHDFFGDPHVVTYTVNADSYRMQARWKVCFDILRRAEERLELLDVPSVFFFLARWNRRAPHLLMADGGLESSYMLVPTKYTLGEWRNPPPIEHGSPAANELYGRAVYRLVAERLGWAPLEAEAIDEELPIFEGPPAELGKMRRVEAEALRRFTVENLPESWQPGAAHCPSCTGGLDPLSGTMERAATLLVRRRAGAKTLRVRLRRLPDTFGLYPLEIGVHVPSPSGGSHAGFTLTADGPAEQEMLVSIPEELPAGIALDVVLTADRITDAGEVRRARSLVVVSIDQP